MRILNNITDTVLEDLQETVKKGEEIKPKN